MRGWPVVRLAEICRLDVDEYPVAPDKSYPMMGVLSYGRGLFDKGAVAGSSTSYKKFYRIKRNQIVLSLLFGWEGAITIVRDVDEGFFVSPMFPTFTIDQSRAHSKYVAWFCRRPHVWDLLKAGASGMGDRRRTLRPQQLFDLEIPLPSLDIQWRIVTQLDGVAHRIDQIRAISAGIAADISALIVSANAGWANGVPIPLGEALELAEDRVPVIPGEEYPQIGIRGFGGGLFSKPLSAPKTPPIAISIDFTRVSSCLAR